MDDAPGMNDAARLRIHGRVQPMDDTRQPLVLSLSKDISSRPPAGPSTLNPTKGHTRITVAAYSLCAAAVILLIFRSF